MQECISCTSVPTANIVHKARHTIQIFFNIWEKKQIKSILDVVTVIFATNQT